MPQAKIRQYKPIPPGQYHFAVKACKTRQARDKKEDFLAWTFEVLDEEDLAGIEVDWTSSQEFGKASKAYAFLIACGMPQQEEEVPVDTDDFVGCEFYATVSLKPADANGVIRNKFESFLSVEAFEKAASKHTARPAAHATARPAPAPAAAPEPEPEPEPEPVSETPPQEAAPAPAPAPAPARPATAAATAPRKPTPVGAKPAAPQPATAPAAKPLSFPK